MKLISNPMFLFVVGLILVTLGAMLKIMHLKAADYVLPIGLVTEMSALIWFFAKKIKTQQ